MPRSARSALPVAALWLAAPAAAAGAPTISGADGDVWSATAPEPAYTIDSTLDRSVQWRLDGGPWSAGAPSPLDVTLDDAGDGPHVLAARETTALGLPIPPRVERRFRVDTTPPAITIRVPAEGAVYAQGQPVAASFSCAGAATCTGPVADGQPLATGAPGPATFRVRAVDDAGNTATAAVGYTVAPAPAAPAGSPASAQVIRIAPPAPQSATADPPTSNAGRLTPAAGTRLSTRTPVLSWRPRAGARLYNLQIFAVEGTELRKVHSRFPAEARYRVPRDVLLYGRRYVWRAWPYVGRAYTAAPVGLSWFDVERPVGLTPGQLLVTQRIAQAAVRRVAAVEGWLAAGLAGGDLRDGALGRVEFAGGVSLAGAGAPIANGLATPRPVVERPPARRGEPVRVTVSRRQLLINQRISQAAVRRATALERRLTSGLTAGDLRDGAVTASKLAPGLFVAAAPGAGPVVAASRTVTPAPGRGARGRVELSDAQALINQRVAQAAVRRANRLRALAERGVSGAQFRDGTIGGAKISAELR